MPRSIIIGAAVFIRCYTSVAVLLLGAVYDLDRINDRLAVSIGFEFYVSTLLTLETLPRSVTTYCGCAAFGAFKNCGNGY